VFDLADREVSLLLADRPRQVDLLRDVAAESSVADREVEDQRQGPVDLPNRRR
jgi:hypothetical protein